MENENDVMQDVRSVNYEEMFVTDENGLNSKQRHFAELYRNTGEVGKSYAIAYHVKDNSVALIGGSKLSINFKVDKLIAGQLKKRLQQKSCKRRRYIEIINFNDD